MISSEDIEKLAALSRIEVSDEEKGKLGSDIESILGYVSEIQDVVTGGITQAEKSPVHNVMREDESPHESGIYTEILLAEAPAREGNFVRVKKILPSNYDD
ncbi:MAG: hypothetical protein Greene041614_407 [Parcubacteria group bacterium Greene0416_14]|nr:MAG: hypothetical protein Greene041614_407 [Parcubacteria group bacterium Greene0416_14]TSD00928.1 MAG: glutamyl-tRNA(Gln) amidotransferase subunit C [Parcubacteria group bacterium Greene1014_15]